MIMLKDETVKMKENSGDSLLYIIKEYDNLFIEKEGVPWIKMNY